MKKLLAIAVTIVIAFYCSPLSVNASEIGIETAYTYYDSNDTKIIGYDDQSGNMVFEEYISGILTQRNTIYKTNPNAIVREFLAGRSSGTSSDIMYISDYITTGRNECGVSPAAIITAGTINYRRPDDLGNYYHYSLICTYTSTSPGNTTYTVNSFTGKLLDLIALLVGALTVPQIVASEYLNALLFSLGIAVVQGILQAPLSDTVSCYQTDYTWTLTDKTDNTHVRNAYAIKYYINDYTSSLQGQTYYSGFAPAHWRTQELAVYFHDTMYGYPIWEVESWT